MFGCTAQVSAGAGDPGQIGGVFAKLAAIATVFFLWGIREPDARIWLASQWSAPPRSLSRSPSAHQVNDQNDECDHQQQMNQTPSDVESKTQEPKDKKNCHNRPSNSHCHHLRPSTHC
jgi:hypothetical protein